MSFFCKLPWINIETGTKPNARPCCQWTGPSIPISEYFSSDELIGVKTQLLDGKVPRQCASCHNDELRTGYSLRLSEKSNDPELEKEILSHRRPDWFNIQRLSIKCSNVCNLKCLPCTVGSFIREKEYFDLGFRPRPPILQRKDDLHLYRDLGFRQLTLGGGEPFYDGLAWGFLRDLVDSDQSKQIRVDINSNMTAATHEKLDWLAENFQHVIIKASIDGIGPRNEYLRWPSSWSTIHDNVMHAAARKNITTVITTALSNLSLLTFDEVICYAVENKLNLFITPVTSPEPLNVNHLPQAIKKKLLTRYKELREKIKDDAWDKTLAVVDAVIRICENDSDWNLEDTQDFVEKHDRARGTQILDVFPELENYFTRRP
jgi:hypothetical protein